jgi:hypothetical protein
MEIKEMQKQPGTAAEKTKSEQKEQKGKEKGKAAAPAPEGQKKEQPKAERSKNAEKPIISIDTKVEDVVKWDSEGAELYFADDPEKFLELPSDVAGGLGFYNKQRYYTARNIMKGTMDLSGYDKRKFKPQPGTATAGQQLRVDGKDSRFHYCWKRPDELQQAQRNGYRVADDPALDTFYGDVGSTRTVGQAGSEEMVLMKIPREAWEKKQADNRTRSKARRAAVEENAINEMLKGGGKPYKPEEE